MAYTALTFVYGEVLTAAKMNLMSANDASFHDGSGIGSGAIVEAKISSGGVTNSKIANGTVASDKLNWSTFNRMVALSNIIATSNVSVPVSSGRIGDSVTISNQTSHEVSYIVAAQFVAQKSGSGDLRFAIKTTGGSFVSVETYTDTSGWLTYCLFGEISVPANSSTTIGLYGRHSDSSATCTVLASSDYANQRPRILYFANN